MNVGYKVQWRRAFNNSQYCNVGRKCWQVILDIINFLPNVGCLLLGIHLESNRLGENVLSIIIKVKVVFLIMPFVPQPRYTKKCRYKEIFAILIVQQSNCFVAFSVSLYNVGTHNSS